MARVKFKGRAIVGRGMIKKVAYVDRMWGYPKDRNVCGDMGFSFCDSIDTRSENIEEVLGECREYALGDGAVDGNDTPDPNDASFAIYEVYKAKLFLEDDGDWLGSGVVEDKELIEVNVCATKNVAEWVEEVEKRYNGVTINYREED